MKSPPFGAHVVPGLIIVVTSSKALVTSSDALVTSSVALVPTSFL